MFGLFQLKYQFSSSWLLWSTRTIGQVCVCAWMCFSQPDIISMNFLVKFSFRMSNVQCQTQNRTSDIVGRCWWWDIMLGQTSNRVMAGPEYHYLYADDEADRLWGPAQRSAGEKGRGEKNHIQAEITVFVCEPFGIFIAAAGGEKNCYFPNSDTSSILTLTEYFYITLKL